MSKEENKGQTGTTRGPLDRFEPGGDSGPAEDRNKYEQRLNSLPPDQRELAEEHILLADLCQYFSQQMMDIPPEVLEQVGRLSTLAIVERIRVLKDINCALMEYLNDVGQDPGIRQ